MTQDRVTQADRDCAADLIAWHNAATSEWITHGGNDLRFFALDMPDGIRKGIWDGHDVVQAFARHRIAAERASTPAAPDAVRECIGDFEATCPKCRKTVTKTWIGGCDGVMMWKHCGEFFSPVDEVATHTPADGELAVKIRAWVHEAVIIASQPEVVNAPLIERMAARREIADDTANAILTALAEQARSTDLLSAVKEAMHILQAMGETEEGVNRAYRTLAEAIR